MDAEVPVRRVTLALGIFFDGTGNNALTTQKMVEIFRQQHGNIGSVEAEPLFRRHAQTHFGVSGTQAASYLGYYTNIYALQALYALPDSAGKERIQQAIYIEGVGTCVGKPDCVIGMGFGTGEYGVIAKTDEAIARLASAVSAALASLSGPWVVDCVLFDLFGFSRGAAAARHFANRIQSEDPAIFRAIASAVGDLPRIRCRFIGLFDTVAAIATLANGMDPHGPDTGEVNLVLRPGVAEHVFHIVAQHECRYNFALNSVAPAWPELLLPGAHSDIGGGYLPRIREDLFLTRPQVETVPWNEPGERSRVYRQAVAQLSALNNAPVMAPLMRTHSVMPATWEDEFAPNDRYGQMQKRCFAALTLRQRLVSADWSQAALWVMLDAARAAGVLFDEPTLHLPEALIPLVERARQIGKAVRVGSRINGFSTQELDTLAQDYIHCSANWNSVTVNDAGELYGGAAVAETLGFVNRPDEGWVRTVYDLNGKKW